MYKLIFKNEHFIIVDKAANVLTVPSRLGKSDERACLGIKLGQDFKTQIMPVHRLDYEVSGLVMFATNKEAQMRANQWFEKKHIFKTYSAICTKLPDAIDFKKNEEMTWECLLAKGKKRAYIADFGKHAITKVKLVDVRGDQYFFDLNPITGRSHQLRFEMYRHQYPILGDALYSSPVKSLSGISLRAYRLDLSNCSERFNFDLPEFFEISKN
jgi:tRNA pseudouridine32 synthase/23S rRNA pseudouridine746 synthase